MNSYTGMCERVDVLSWEMRKLDFQSGLVNAQQGKSVSEFGVPSATEEQTLETHGRLQKNKCIHYVGYCVTSDVPEYYC